MKVKLEESLRALGLFLQENDINPRVSIATCSFTHAALYTDGGEIQCSGGTVVKVCGRGGMTEFDLHDPDSFGKILEIIKKR